MTQKTLSKISQAVTVASPTTQTPQQTTEGILGTKFTVFAMAFNVVGILAVTFGNTAFSGNIAVADLVLGTSLVCLTASLFRSTTSKIKQKFGGFL
jgi:hypothetical protein